MQFLFIESVTSELTLILTRPQQHGVAVVVFPAVTAATELKEPKCDWLNSANHLCVVKYQR